jgi:hypothetical protein
VHLSVIENKNPHHPEVMGVRALLQNFAAGFPLRETSVLLVTAVRPQFYGFRSLCVRCELSLRRVSVRAYTLALPCYNRATRSSI